MRAHGSSKTSRHDDGAFEVVPFRGKREWMSKAIVDVDGNLIAEEMLNEIGVSHSRPMRASVIELSLETSKGGAPPGGSTARNGNRTAKVRIEVVPRVIRLMACRDVSPRRTETPSG